MQFSLNSLRFEDVRQNIIDYLKANGKYTAEFDFQGSNIDYIISSMAYTSMLMSYQLSMVANNVFLDTTEIRKNAVSIAKTLGYKPNRKKASQISGVIRYNKGANDTATWTSSTTITIPPLTVFTGVNVGLPFLNLDAITLTYKNPLMLEGSFILYQGTMKSFEVFGDGTSLQSITISSTDVEEDNLSVSIKQTIGDQVTQEWEHVKAFFGITNQKIYFVEEDIVKEGYPRILFGNGIVGQIPSLTETIVINYMETKGVDGNDENSFEFPANIVDCDRTIDLQSLNFSQFQFVIPANSYSFGGTDIESLESIKANAPRYFSAAGRAVTENDFRTILSDFPSLKSFDVVGGTELYPGDDSQLGKSYITAVPTFNDFFQSEKVYLAEVEEVDILGAIRDLGIIATRKIFFKPSYVALAVAPSVEVDTKATLEERRTISDAVANNIQAFIENNLSTLGPVYRESKLRSSMDVTAGVISSSVDVSYSLGLNHETFYTNKTTKLFLPSLKAKDDAGNTLYDEFDQPVRSPFLKTNQTLLEKRNEANSTSLKIDQFPVFGSESEASVYCALSHSGRERKIHSKDVMKTTLIEMRETLQSDGTYVPSLNLDYSKFDCTLQDGVTYTPGLLNNGDGSWNLMLDRNYLCKIEFGATNWEASDHNTMFLSLVGANESDFDGSVIVFESFVEEANMNYPSSETTITTQINLITTGNFAELKMIGESRMFDFAWVQSDPENDPLIYEYSITSLQTLNGIELTSEVDTEALSAIISYDGTPIIKIQRSGIFNNFTVLDEDFVNDNLNLRASYSVKTRDVLNSVGEVIGASDALYLPDVFHDVTLSSMNYDTGELVFNKNIDGITKSLVINDLYLNVVKRIPIKTLFDEYSSNNLMDFLSFKQADVLDVDGNVISKVTDFDGRFCQFVVLNVSTPVLKRV